MAKVQGAKGAMVVVAYRGDAKTLLAFDLLTNASRARLAGFTIRVEPAGVAAYYLYNNLRFEHPEAHAQVATETPFSSVNAPIHKFRWLHVPGSAHQGLEPVLGSYTYAVTPRYFDAQGALLAIDAGLEVAVSVDVLPFQTRQLKLGFTRGFTQSQAFVRHFGLKAAIKPKDAGLQFDTRQPNSTVTGDEPSTWQQQYEWLGFTARQRIFELLDQVRDDSSLTLDVFAYDLDEPDVVGVLLKLAADKRVRVILDNADLHHDATGKKPEDQFENLFTQAAGAGRIKRGKFGRYAHDKVLVVYQNNQAIRVLTGSTNFSVTGLYVNANHVLVFEDAGVAGAYAAAFQQAWDADVHLAAFEHSAVATSPATFNSADVPHTSITFSPHTAPIATDILNAIVTRMNAESTVTDGKGSVLFAVMEMDGGEKNPLYDALAKLHENTALFSYGISDNPPGIELYTAGKQTGVLVTGKPVNTQLPAPFNQVPNMGGVGHQVHHKFIVCGFNGADPTVYCGSSNLALAGEQVNGDNLLAIRDADAATAFAIEAIALVDHFNFLDSTAQGPKAKAGAAPQADRQQASVSVGWFLSTDDGWAQKFFDPQDLHCRDRQLFAG